MGTVVLVMVDGLRPDALEAADLRNIERLRERGSSTMRAMSIMPSITLPCHMSIFHSVPPGRHGVTTNDWQPMARPLPGLVDQAKAAGLHTAFFYNWEPLRNLSRPGSLNFSYFRDNVHGDPDADWAIAAEAVRYISDDRPDFAFVYLGTVDISGHAYGWMSREYVAQAERVDGAVGLLLDSLPEDSTVLLQADHGGHERSHGTELPEDMLIPWMVAGPGIRKGYEVEEAVGLPDTAPTLARILGIVAHRDWEGRVIEAIFEGD